MQVTFLKPYSIGTEVFTRHLCQYQLMDFCSSHDIASTPHQLFMKLKALSKKITNWKKARVTLQNANPDLSRFYIMTGQIHLGTLVFTPNLSCLPSRNNMSPVCETVLKGFDKFSLWAKTIVGSACLMFQKPQHVAQSNRSKRKLLFFQHADPIS